LNELWPKGSKAEIARKTGITPQFLNDILSGKNKCPSERAITLQEETKNVAGIDIPLRDWLENRTTTNPYFHNGKEATK
jgi:transcriptional regulator with XRE-family HTH domain